MTDKVQVPTVGRVVHYRSDGGPCWLALVNESRRGTGAIGLVVIPPAPNGVAPDIRQVYVDAFVDGVDGHGWHWPERE